MVNYFFLLVLKKKYGKLKSKKKTKKNTSILKLKINSYYKY